MNYFILASALTIALVIFFFYESHLFDETTFYLTLIFLFILFISSFFAYSLNIKVLDFMLFIIYLYTIPRLLQYGFDPESVNFALGMDVVGFNLSNINEGFSELIYLFCLFFGAIILINAYLTKKKCFVSLFKKNKYEPLYSNLTIYIIFTSFLFFMILEYVLFTNPENSYLSMTKYEKAEMSMALKILTTGFSSDVFLVALIFLVMTDERLKIKSFSKDVIKIIVFSSIIILYCYVGALIGSRGVGVRIILSVFAIFLVCYTNTQQVKELLFFVIVCFVSSILVIFTAQKNRYLLVQSNQYTTKEKCRDCFVKTETFSTKSNVREVIQSNASTPYSFIFNRMNYMDYFLITLSLPIDPKCKEKYMNMIYYYKNFINFLMPGDIYSDAVVSSSNVVGLCYRPKMYEVKDQAGLTGFDRSPYTSQVWTGFGLLKIHGNNLKYFLTFIAGLIFGLVSFIFGKFKSNNGKIINFLWILSAPFTFIYSMGVDHSLMGISVTIIRWSLYFICVSIIEKLRRIILKI